MRKLLLLLISITFLACNDGREKIDLTDMPCESMFIKEADEFEKKTVYRSRDILIKEKDDITIQFYYISDDLHTYYLEMFFFDIRDIQTLIFLFDDNSTIESSNRFYGYSVSDDLKIPLMKNRVLIKDPVYTNFEHKKLKGIRVKSDLGSKDYYIDDIDANNIKKVTQCFYDIEEENRI